MRTLSSELGSHLSELSPRPRIYADANVPATTVSFMRTALEWDVFFVLEHDDLRRAADVEHYRLARQMHRTLVTFDRDYFDDKRFPPELSGGVIVLSAPDERVLAKLLQRLHASLFFPPGSNGGPLPAERALPLLGRKLSAPADWNGSEP
ncbi:MAG: DUF5615 family PIN-like protein [Acidobacteria bacterium]|nr:DUF5615 family PIN-like protein [Acidobacteriota bacterium]